MNVKTAIITTSSIKLTKCSATNHPISAQAVTEKTTSNGKMKTLTIINKLIQKVK